MDLTQARKLKPSLSDGGCITDYTVNWGINPQHQQFKSHSFHNFSLLEEHNNWFLDWGQIHFEVNKIDLFP
jgi:hypothetical protein